MQNGALMYTYIMAVTLVTRSTSVRLSYETTRNRSHIMYTGIVLEYTDFYLSHSFITGRESLIDARKGPIVPGCICFLQEHDVSLLQDGFF